MKLKLSTKLKNVGNALLVALLLCSILCVTVGGYLSVAEQQNYLSARSQSWNMAITVVEAGIEEGIEHLTVNIANPGADGWSFDGSWYNHTNTLPNGDGYVVSATVTNPFQPVLVCRATIKTPTLLGKAASPFFFAAANVPPPATTVKRAVQVKTIRGSLFTKAMVAKQTIDMNGQNILTDSFDSGSLLKSSYGHYNSSVYAGNNGDVASNDTVVNTISGGNANIYGHVQTGPNGTVSIGNNGGIGSHTWQAANPGAIEGNNTEGQVWYSHDSNFTFPITGIPYGSGLTPEGSATIVTVNYNINSNYLASQPYPNPPPWSGVTTNVTGTNSQGSYPGPQPGLVTNLVMTLNSCPNYPAAGTYVGSVTTNKTQQSDKSLPGNGCYLPPAIPHGSHFDFWSIDGYVFNKITGYSWPTLSYNFAQFQTNSIYTTNTYDHVLRSGSYYITDSSQLSGNTIVLGNATLVIANGLNMGGSDGIKIANGAGLILYSGGTSAKISGNGIVNEAGYAQNFIMYCAETVTSVTFDGNGEFIGVIAAPNANATMNGGGHADNDFEGALVVNSVTMNGHFGFHYDEALGRQSATGRLLITSWDEISPN